MSRRLTGLSPAMHALTVTLALLPAMLGAAEPEQAPAVLAAESIAFDSGVVLLDKALLEHRDWVAEVIEAEIKEAKQVHGINNAAIQRAARQITDAGFDLVGMEKAGPAYDEAFQKRVENLTHCELPAYLLPDHVTVYVLNKDTAKNYLRAGGRLPFTSYNRSTDKANIHAYFKYSQHDVLLPGIILYADMPLDKEQVFSRDNLVQDLRETYLYPKQDLIAALFESLKDAPPPDPNQPLADVSLMDTTLGSWQSIFEEQTQLLEDEHTAWFTSGLSFVLTELTLKQIGAERAAWMYRELISGGGNLGLVLPEEPNPDSYLRYWPRKYEIRFKNSEYSQKRSDYREAASYYEIQRLIEHITPNRIPELFRMLKEEKIDTTAKLEAAIQARFNYDIGARLDLYQPAGTAEELYQQAVARAFKHRDANELGDYVHALNLAHEMQVGRSMKDMPGVYRLLQLAVLDMENERAAHAAVIRAWWNVLERQPEPPSDDLLRELGFSWVTDAVAANDLTLAYGLIEKLDHRPLNFAGLIGDGDLIEQFLRLIRASKHIDDGELDKARELIDLVWREFPKDKAPEAYEMYLLPNINLLETRIHSQRPIAPVLG